MGDDIKITVIATGFKDAQPQRRERMLGNAAELDSGRSPYAPRISPRVQQTPFASEVNGASGRPSGEPPVAVGASPPAPHSASETSASIPVVRVNPTEQPRITEASRESVPARASFTAVHAETIKPATSGQHTAPSQQPAISFPGHEPADRPAATEPAELVPVSASVFDDDFFQKGNDELRASSFVPHCGHSA